MDAQDEQISSLFQTGQSQRAIARLTGFSQPGVRKRLLRLGLLQSRDNQGDNLLRRGSDNGDNQVRQTERDNQGDNHLPGRCEKCGRKIPPPPQPWACCGGCIVDGTHLWVCDEANGVEAPPACVSARGKKQGKKQGL